MKRKTFSGVVVLVIAVIGILANLATILGWLGISPPNTMASFKLDLSCNNNSEVISSAQETEVKHLDTFFHFVEKHNGQKVNIDFVLENDGANNCARVDTEERITPDYEKYSGAIYISEFDAEPAYHSSKNHQYISNVIDRYIIQINAFWPQQWARENTLIIPQIRELKSLSSYSTGNKYCTRCFSGVFEVHMLDVPTSSLYTIRTPRD